MLLDERSAPEYLRRRGVLSPGLEATAAPLGGGVSGTVLLVEGDGVRVVVKQSLPRLRVEQEWLAPSERILIEGAALSLTHELTPERVPAVLDLDEEVLALTIEAAPAGWRPWKEQLLSGDVDPGVAAELGRVLARWHSATAASPEARERFGDRDVFDRLRVDPFHRAVARVHPELVDAIGETVEAMLARRDCLVHGDFSPKNVLVGDGALWVLDHETAHTGDPLFDLAFLLAHLALKTVHRPSAASAYAACAEAFLAAYGASDPAGVAAHLACLLLARVDGKSPADYLDESERTQVRALAVRMLRERDADPLAPWH